MPEIPECLNRRYQALDDLIKDLSSPMYPSTEEDYVSSDPANDVGVKLMCNFWNILKEDPDCNLTRAVRQHMGLSAKASRTFHPQRVTCYMSCKGNDDKKDANKKHICEKSPEQKSPEPRGTCCSSKSVSPKNSEKSETMPLSKVLCNLKEAISFDKKCNIRIGELLAAEKQLQDQIQHLEHKEKEGIKMLKQADCMWSCMEEAYKKKVAESQERQNALLNQLKEVEASNNKWRKNKKDLEFQCDNVNKCYFEITEKMNEKKNDVKCMKMEIENLKKRMESHKKDTEAVKKSFSSKKSVSDAKVANLSAEITKMNKKIQDEVEHKLVKEAEGTRYVKEARDDLQKICRVLLQKRLENEDLKAEKESVLEEIDILKETCKQCQEKCKNKQQTVIDEIAKVDSEIAGFRVRCIRCHECTDTADVRKFCSDCPRCAKERDCLLEDDHCIPDTGEECVCMSTKEKFLDNVFDNMYTVLERQVKTGPGKAVAEAVLNCLKRSRNGKLTGETKKILQDFVLTTVRKNLNLTIIGGAVKTRCEMDAETYKQLMLCLKQVKTVKAPKADKGTAAKKDPCRRWGGTSECNCPKGPKGCICTRRAPPPPNEPDPCPPSPPNKEDAGEVMVCPHKDSIACGADCAMHGVPSAVGAEVATWRPAPCDEKQCQFSKNMRAAQCVLGPDSLSAVTQSKGYISTAPYMHNVIDLEDQITCKCGHTTTKPCSCRKDIKHLTVEVDQCDEDSCAMIWKEAKETIKCEATETKKTHTKRNKKMVEEKKSPIKGDKANASNIKREELKLKTASNYYRSDKKDSVKHRQMLTKSTEPKKPCLENKNVTFCTDPEPKKDQKKCSCDEHFEVSIEKERGQFTKLTNTPSGSLAMELNESLIKKIEQKMERNPSMTVSFQRSKSGHLLVDFSPLDSSINTQKIHVNRSSSGALIFEVDKNVVNILKPDANSKYLELDKKSSISVSITPKKAGKDTDKDGEFEQDKIIKNTDLIERENTKEATIDKEIDAKCRIMKIKEINGAYTTVKTNVTKTDSGVSAFVIADKSGLGLFGVVLDKNKENPVLLSESPSGSLLLNAQSATPNATMRKTSSGNIIVVKVNSTETKKNFSSHKPQDIFKVSLNEDQLNVGNLPIALKSTPSENYVVVMDKEYETCYRKTIKEHLDLNYHCPLELNKTTSGNYMVSLVKNDESTEANALLARSLSGTIKVVRDTDGKRLSTSSSTLCTECPSKIVKNLLNTLPVSSYKLEKYKAEKPRLIETKSSSDSNLLEKVKIQLHNQQNLLTQPSALLKKTSSGQYAVVLNKESKKNIINSLKTYLASNSQGLVPIKRTKSGEITIVLNSDNESKSQYGSLKITPSGNIYVLVEEKVMTGLMRKDDIEPPITIVDHLVRHDLHADGYPVNKGVTTTCNAFPDNCSCDPSQCVCGDLLKHGVLESYSNRQCSFKFCPQKESDINRCELKCLYKCSDCGQCPENCDGMRFDENSPHIVIKPCNCRSKFEKSSEPDSLYYFTEAVCPYHKDRYESLSNEIIEISGLCKKSSKIITRSKKSSQNHSNQGSLHFEPTSLDYLDNLPPQLPHFLKDFRCA